MLARYPSPLRYPGGKSWLVPKARDLLQGSGFSTLVEPFAGGANVGLAAGIEGWVEHVVLVEKDPVVAEFWKIVFSDNVDELIARIEGFTCSRENVETVLAGEKAGVEGAFRAYVRNRTSFSGIMSAGKGGLLKTDIGMRWSPRSGVERIRKIREHVDRFTFIAGDGLSVLPNYFGEDCVWFVDPPYSLGSKSPGDKLYEHSVVDHERLFVLMGECSGGVIATYNNDEHVRGLVQRHGLNVSEIGMWNKNHVKQKELLITNTRMRLEGE